MNSQEGLKNNIFIHFNDHFFSLEKNSTTGQVLGIDKFPRFLFRITPIRCNECCHYILIEGETEAFDVHEREMGPETYWGGTNEISYGNCDRTITITTTFWHYAWSWFCEFGVENAEIILVEYLERFLEEWHKLKTKRSE